MVVWLEWIASNAAALKPAIAHGPIRARNARPAGDGSGPLTAGGLCLGIRTDFTCARRQRCLSHRFT